MFIINKLNRVVNSSLRGILFLATVVVVPQHFAQSLIGHWAMEENSGAAVLVDSSSYGHDATISGGGLIQVDGQRGYAQDFDFSDDYAAVGDNINLDITGDLTLAAWIKPNQKATMSIIKKNGTGSGYELYCSTTPPGYVMAAGTTPAGRTLPA